MFSLLYAKRACSRASLVCFKKGKMWRRKRYLKSTILHDRSNDYVFQLRWSYDTLHESRLRAASEALRLFIALKLRSLFGMLADIIGWGRSGGAAGSDCLLLMCSSNSDFKVAFWDPLRLKDPTMEIGLDPDPWV